jgi:predicted phosphodiesterase
MKYAIISDVHANLEALVAVLDAAEGEGAERIVCLGDIVGYHADPDPCVALLRERAHRVIAGNHDLAAVGLLDYARFGKPARIAMDWTKRTLSDESRRYLAALPLVDRVDDRFFVFHAALHPAPNVELHLSSPERVEQTFEAFVRDDRGVRVAFFGHTHRGVAYERRGDRVAALDGASLRLDPDAHYLINPGSVGQPRDGDPRASFALFDEAARSVHFHRVTYNVRACREKAARAGLFASGEGPIQKSLHRLNDWLESGLRAVQRRIS